MKKKVYAHRLQEERAHQVGQEAEGAGGRCGQESLLWFLQKETTKKTRQRKLV